MERERFTTTIEKEIKKMIKIEAAERSIQNNELLECIFIDFYKKSKSERDEIIKNGIKYLSEV